MAKYSDLSVLRGKLTDDDPDERAAAYQAVLEADVQPSEVLSSEPPAEPLRAAGVIPEASGDDRVEAAELRERQVELLEQIRDAVSGSSS